MGGTLNALHKDVLYRCHVQISRCHDDINALTAMTDLVQSVGSEVFGEGSIPITLPVTSHKYLSDILDALLVLANGSHAVGVGSLQECPLGLTDVLLLSLPGLETGLLESTSVGEGELPGARHALDDIHGMQVEGSILLRLATREEYDTW